MVVRESQVHLIEDERCLIQVLAGQPRNDVAGDADPAAVGVPHVDDDKLI